MKGLLHSKKFRTNLKKWLFMYVGVMVLLTTVVTYSKYISSTLYSDEAKIDEFDLNITQVACPIIEDETPAVCNAEFGSNSSVCRPTSVVASCFTLDVGNLNVHSDLWLTFDSTNAVLPNTSTLAFNIQGIDLIKGNTIESTIYSNTGSDSLNDNSWTSSNENNRLKLHTEIDAEDTGIWTIRVRSKKVLTAPSDYTKYDGELVKVGYVMEQITTGGGN